MATNDRSALLGFRDEDENEDPHFATAYEPDNDGKGKRGTGERLRHFVVHCWRTYVPSGKTIYGPVIIGIALVFLVGTFITSIAHRGAPARIAPCSTVDDGYVCYKKYSRLWGQYSPFFSLASESDISGDVPPGCNITLAQVLSRHGARYPTTSKTIIYEDLIRRIQSKATAYGNDYEFLRNFEYPLGEEAMTAFGEAQMDDLGTTFYQRYQHLGRDSNPFVRAAGSPRVIASADRFIEGFDRVRTADPNATGGEERPVLGVVIPEEEGSNNTLNHGTCTRFEEGDSFSEIDEQFGATYLPAIRGRVNSNLSAANLSSQDIVYLMDMCPFHTVADSPDASTISPFCALFTPEEWKFYDYHKSLEKYYNYGAGNALGATQGVGFVNELIARLTHSPVRDSTSVNTTLDNDPATFPLNRTLYADFSHDNTMTSIFTALGFFNLTPPLSPAAVQAPNETEGYAASWTVPFAGRACIEKMECDSTLTAGDPYVRVLINDRVAPLRGCAVDSFGRCQLTDFIAGLEYARSGGNWEDCYR